MTPCDPRPREDIDARRTALGGVTVPTWGWRALSEVCLGHQLEPGAAACSPSGEHEEGTESFIGLLCATSVRNRARKHRFPVVAEWTYTRPFM